MTRALAALWLGLVVIALTACNVNPYDLGARRDGGRSDGGGDDDDGGNTSGDGGTDGTLPIDAARCVPTPELCNTLDDDCDGTPDNGFNLAGDPNNCGSCGNRCTYDNAFGVCTTGMCGQGTCLPGWHDTVAGTPGCEYFCIPTGGEVCDNRDNDCNDMIDEVFNRETDVNNCGTCGNVCNLLHASATCEMGVCTIDACETGFVDIDPTVPGCEYVCTQSNGGVERCDGSDNNCDGTIDDGNPGGGSPCGTDVGECTAGSRECMFGVLFCIGEIRGGPEVCDGEDDDCDMMIDEPIDKVNDPQHCGSCLPCNLPNAIEGCANSMCTVASCAFGFHNLNGAPADGCEYACIVTGDETCDGVDNDCDGTPDEGINITTDPSNCGSCGTICGFANAGALCVASACQRGTCNPNFHDVNGLPGDGCEYGCIISNGGVEICDGRDNDCDTIIDDGNPGGGVSCGTSTGECSTGTTVCTAGTVVCPDDVGPATESCNTFDDDCDGLADDGFDKLNDPRYCRNCMGCSLPNAVAGCALGSCTVAGCLAGWVDQDRNASNGCEYNCTVSGPEVCDGRDNDCDLLTDGADPDLVAPANFCRNVGACATMPRTAPTCTGATGWRCIYPATVETQMNGDVALEETRCDNLDNDCDGGADEVFVGKGSACAEDGTFGTSRRLGACRGTGTLGCNATQNGLRCNVTAAGAAPVNETCDNRDNDCDGHVDEPYDNTPFTGVRDAKVGPVSIPGSGNIVMYRYEATRPDATSASQGFIETRACSVAGRMPWAGGDFNEAQTACQNAGMRLCRVGRPPGQTYDEWGRYCGANGVTLPDANLAYPYSDTFAANSCNGDQYDPLPLTPVNEDQAIATGSLATCQWQPPAVVAPSDQSGNLKEWVDDPRVIAGVDVRTLRGGSFNNFQHGLTCDFDITVVPTDYTFDNVGFRCCSSCADGQIECSGACVNPATSSNNCGGCGQICATGNCTNGYCCPTGTRACGDVCVANTIPVCP